MDPQVSAQEILGGGSRGKHENGFVEPKTLASRALLSLIAYIRAQDAHELLIPHTPFTYKTNPRGVYWCSMAWGGAGRVWVPPMPREEC